MEDVRTISETGKKKTLRRILILFAAAVVLLVLLVLGLKLLSRQSSQPAPVLVAEKSHYQMFEVRNNEILLGYEITLRNETGKDLEDFALRATLQEDYKNGYILSPNASVRQWNQNAGTTFTLTAGQTRTFDLVIAAPYFRNSKEPSKTLPELYIIYPDGSEGKIEME